MIYKKNYTDLFELKLCSWIRQPHLQNRMTKMVKSLPINPLPLSNFKGMCRYILDSKASSLQNGGLDPNSGSFWRLDPDIVYRRIHPIWRCKALIPVLCCCNFSDRKRERGERETDRQNLPINPPPPPPPLHPPPPPPYPPHLAVYTSFTTPTLILYVLNNKLN